MTDTELEEPLPARTIISPSAIFFDALGVIRARWKTLVAAAGLLALIGYAGLGLIDLGDRPEVGALIVRSLTYLLVVAVCARVAARGLEPEGAAEDDWFAVVATVFRRLPHLLVVGLALFGCTALLGSLSRQLGGLGNFVGLVGSATIFTLLPPAIPAVLDKDMDPVGALRKSITLVRPYFFIVLLVLVGVSLAASAIVTIPLFFLTRFENPVLDFAAGLAWTLLTVGFQGVLLGAVYRTLDQAARPEDSTADSEPG